MRAFVLGAVLALEAATFAQAKDFTRTVIPGQTTRMKVYKSWNTRDCSPNTGIVKVLTKPQHGKLTPRKVAAKMA